MRVLLVSCLLLVACGGRPASSVDGALESPDRGLVKLDSSMVQPDRGPASPDRGLPSGPCATNADCPGQSFCEHDGLCVVTGAAAGTCKPIPICKDGGACLGVCGCDGQTYCSSCDAHEAGVSVAAAAPCLAATCAGLEVLYQAELKKAKTCCPMCATAALQCVDKIAGSLHCGCDTFVNGVSPALQAIQAEFIARSCHFSMPPCGIKCAPPGPGFCGNGSFCIDGGD